MNSQALIAELSLKHHGAKPTSFARVYVQWLAMTLASVILTVVVLGVRPDMAQQLTSSFYIIESSLALIVVLATGAIACSLAFPDHARSSLTRIAVGIVTAGYALFIANSIFCFYGCPQSEKLMPHTFECLDCIVAFSLIPAIWAFWRLRRLATIHPVMLGATSLLMAVTIGCFGRLLVEEEMLMDGMFLWHYAPVFILSFIGMGLGKKVFSW